MWNFNTYPYCCPYCSTDTTAVFHYGDCPYREVSQSINTISIKPTLPSLQRSPAELIDALITVDIKCYMFQDKQAEAETFEEKGMWGEKVMELNRKRNNIMRALDSLLGYGESTVTPKSYMEDKGNDLGKEF